MMHQYMCLYICEQTDVYTYVLSTYTYKYVSLSAYMYLNIRITHMRL